MAETPGILVKQVADLAGHAVALDVADFDHARTSEHVELLETLRADDNGADPVGLAIVDVILNLRAASRLLSGFCFGGFRERRRGDKGQTQHGGKCKVRGRDLRLVAGHGASRCFDEITYRAPSVVPVECKPKSDRWAMKTD